MANVTSASLVTIEIEGQVKHIVEYSVCAECSSHSTNTRNYMHTDHNTHAADII